MGWEKVLDRVQEIQTSTAKARSSTIACDFVFLYSINYCWIIGYPISSE
jgi:hypothetical protein